MCVGIGAFCPESCVQGLAGFVYLHLITALEKERVQIGNNHGRINGWTPKSNVYGRATRIDNSGGR